MFRRHILQTVQAEIFQNTSERNSKQICFRILDSSARSTTRCVMTKTSAVDRSLIPGADQSSSNARGFCMAARIQKEFKCGPQCMCGQVAFFSSFTAACRRCGLRTAYIVRMYPTPFCKNAKLCFLTFSPVKKHAVKFRKCRFSKFYSDCSQNSTCFLSLKGTKRTLLHFTLFAKLSMFK